MSIQVFDKVDVKEHWLKLRNATFSKLDCPKCGSEKAYLHFARNSELSFYCPDCKISERSGKTRKSLRMLR